MADYPVHSPLFTALLVRKLVEEARTEEARRRGQDGHELLWASDAGSCARKLGLQVLGHTPSEPMDAAGLWVTFIGRLIHDALQAVAQEVFGDAIVAEIRFVFDDLSLSARLDLLLRLDGKTIAYELKTVGGFGFDKSVGIIRKGVYGLAPKGPEGPRASAKIQGALSALAADADELRIGHISLEAVSKQLAQKLNWGEEDRILAEWVYTREQFEPWALAEKARMARILDVLGNDTLPDRWAVGDDMLPVRLNPDAARPPWQCSYCSMRTLCELAGSGEVALPIPGVPEP